MNFGCLLRKMKSLVVLASMVIVASTTGCAAPTASDSDSEHTATTQQAITNGDDDDADPAVVGLMLQGQLYCTGVLVAKNIVATAAHCVSPTPPDQVYFGSNPKTKKGTFIDVSDSKAHPDFDEDTLVNDIAVVGLATKAPVAPMPVHLKPFDPSFKRLIIRIVGFGVTAGGSTTDTRKRTGDTSIDSYGDVDFRFHATPSQTCSGDSGGPAFAMIDGKETVIGITSSGDADCKVYGRDMRLDAFLPFLQGYAKAYSLKTSAPAQASSGCSTTRVPAQGARAAVLLLGLVVAAVAGRRKLRHS